MRHLIQICNLATGSKVVSWTGSLNSQLQLRELRNHCVRIYAQLAPLIISASLVCATASSRVNFSFNCSFKDKVESRTPTRFGRKSFPRVNYRTRNVPRVNIGR